ncbi:ATP-binding protein [Actinosynnema sp. NPDC047251]|uniref:histidine kinase n=1 Tax=Saccharothrix espanaensis (strain ATCC 51144 / DSM 44229 / JCM 9112 / NBRC 15066 / NRRL 15764) TaxID=1179773 RepID=K0JYH7_SACES|nr:ATP-binding protein [Saccharothrix espanaensis]CCH31181.1 putative two-component system sensor kinase [Saccharothrix espanaensis DSM 44229]
MSLRASAALAAGLACAGVFGLGGLAARAVVYNGQLRAAESTAGAELGRVVDSLRSGRPPAAAGGGLSGDALFEIVTDTGEVVVRSAALARLDPARGALPPAPAGAPADWSTRTTTDLRPGEHPDWREYRSYTVLGAVARDVPAALVEPLGRAASTPWDGLAGTDDARRYRLTAYLFVLPWDAQSAMRGVSQLLLHAVPLAVLFVMVVAWLATGRTLRPVEAIRREMAEIGEHALDRRVPVPPSRDEVSRLADTTNATLDRLEQAHRRQQRFVADASHELRSPLANLRAGLEVALVHADRADWPRTASRALGDVQRLQDLVADLLLLAESEAGDPVPPVEVDLAVLAHEQAAERGPLVRCSAEGEVLVRGRLVRLDRLLRNLLDNAERHARSQVTVRVRAAGSEAVVEVLDDGPGIPPEERERVFERFTRLDDARARDTGGSGLGLAIARGIAWRHGGTLRVADSDTGALLVATLPLLTDHPAETSPRA